jgi:hypothetical protein
MAKSRKSKKQRDDEEDEDDVIEAEPFEDEEEEYDEREKSEKVEAPKSKGFFQQVGDSLKSAGQTAEKYTRIGITMAELEKLRMDLKSSYQKLGETITRCWDAAPEIGVSAHDSDVKDHVKKVNALRRQIREVEAKIRTLKTGAKEEAKSRRS